MESVYMDHASATPVRRAVVEAMLPYFAEKFGNPSTVYAMGSEIKETMEAQRAKVAGLIGANAGEIIFTSSGAEANNLAVKGAALARRTKGNHVIVSAIEHHSVLNAARFLERLDFEITFLPVDAHGLVDPERLRQAITPETVLVSVMHANNEIGTIEPAAELGAVCREKGVVFHTDAVATVGRIPVNVGELNVDLLSFSGVSVGAPKGIGALYFRKNVRLMPLIHGGIQESGRRGGTENIPGIVALGTAAELAGRDLREKMPYVQELRDRLVSGILDRIEKVRYTGHPEKRLPHHASFCIEAIEGEALIFTLNRHGICANTGSACASKALKTSPVLGAIKIPAELAQGSIVFTLDESNRPDEVDFVIDRMCEAVDRLRALSPVWRRQAAATSNGNRDQAQRRL